MNKTEFKFYSILFCIFIIFYFLFGVFSYAFTLNKKNIPLPSSTPSITSTPVLDNYPILSWEKEKPERKEWSKILFLEIEENFTSLEKAQDFSRYCPKYKTLTDEQKKMAWAEFWVALMYFESGWKPKSQSVDVGTKSDKNTWSVGLTQISQVDQKNHKFNFGYTFDDLLEVKPNLDLAFAIFTKQIEKQKLVCVPKNVYWAVVSCRPLARYQKNDQIAARLMKNYFLCK